MSELTSEPTEEITIIVPVDLARFIREAIQSGRYLWMISYMNPIIPDQIEHGRTSTDGFPAGNIIRYIEQHKVDLTEHIIVPMQLQRGVNYTAVDAPGQEPDNAKIITLPAQEEVKLAKQVQTEITAIKQTEDDGSWE